MPLHDLPTYLPDVGSHARPSLWPSVGHRPIDGDSSLGIPCASGPDSSNPQFTMAREKKAGRRDGTVFPATNLSDVKNSWQTP